MYNKKTRNQKKTHNHKKIRSHKKTRKQQKIRKIKGGNVDTEDCINKDDPITLEPLTSSDIIIKFQPNPNQNRFNCYDRDALKTHILHQLNIETENDNNDPVDNVRDPSTNIQLGRHFIETNFPEINLPDLSDSDDDRDSISNASSPEDHLLDFTAILNEIENEHDYGERLEDLYTIFEEQLNNVGRNIDDNILFEFTELLSDYVTNQVNDDNKTYELHNRIDDYIDDNDERVYSGGKKKKQFLYNPNDPKKSFDVYIDKNPNDTIHIKYTTIEDIKKTIRKLERLYKQHKYTHQRIWQVGMIMKVRLEALKKHHKTLYPKAKNVSKRYNLANKYFHFLSSRTKLPENKRRTSTFHFT